MTIPKWFSAFRKEVLCNLQKRFEYICQDLELEENDPCVDLWRMKLNLLTCALDMVSRHFDWYQSRDKFEEGCLACFNCFDGVDNLDVYNGLGGHGSSLFAMFVFASGNVRRRVMTMGGGGIRVAWDIFEEGKGIVALTEEDSHEEFFDEVLGIDWGLLACCHVRHGDFSTSVNMIDCEDGLDGHGYAGVAALFDEIESAAEMVYELACEALERDFNGGGNFDEAKYGEDYVLRYAAAIVRTLPPSPEANMALHDLENVFVRMRKYERITFDYNLLQRYSSEEEWRHEIKIKDSTATIIRFTAQDFMRSLYGILPKRLIDQCTRGAVGLEEDTELLEDE